MRRSFLRLLGVNPQAYRERFPRMFGRRLEPDERVQESAEPPGQAQRCSVTARHRQSSASSATGR